MDIYRCLSDFTTDESAVDIYDVVELYSSDHSVRYAGLTYFVERKIELNMECFEEYIASANYNKATNVCAHELAHAMALSHNHTDTTSIIQPFATSVITLSDTDKRSISYVLNNY